MPDRPLLILFAILAAVVVWGVWIGPWLRERGWTRGDGSGGGGEGVYLGGGGAWSDDASPGDAGDGSDSGDAGDGGGD